MLAQTITTTRTYIVCPACGQGRHRIDHLQSGQSFGPWACPECGVDIHGFRTPTGADVEVSDQPPRRRGLMLLKLAASEPPVFMVVAQDIDPGDADEIERHLTYLVEEHTCPTNLVPVEAILTDGDADPHGILEFVQIIDRPPDWDTARDDNSWTYYAGLFDRLPGQIIEGECATVELKRIPR